MEKVQPSLFDRAIKRSREMGSPRWEDAIVQAQLTANHAARAANSDRDPIDQRVTAFIEAVCYCKWDDARAELTFFRGHFAALKSPDENVLDEVLRANRKIDEAEKEQRAGG